MKTALAKARVSHTEKDSFQIAAWLRGMSLSGWIRQHLRKAAAEELRAAGKVVPFLEEK